MLQRIQSAPHHDHVPDCGSTSFHERIEQRAQALSEDLKSDRTSGYRVHGLFGIFADGSANNVTDTKARRSALNYEGVKTRFMATGACTLGRARRTRTVCEIGFNAGLSALLLLEAVPDATVFSFDLGDMPWSRRADSLLQAAYGERFPGVIFGDSAKTLPAHARQSGGFRCDIIFIDGSKSYRGRLTSVLDARNISRLGRTLVFLDEVSSMACVNGTFDETTEHLDRCRRGFPDAARAYTTASRRGLLNVLECAWPRRYRNVDGICAATFPDTTGAARLAAADEDVVAAAVQARNAAAPPGLVSAMPQRPSPQSSHRARSSGVSSSPGAHVLRVRLPGAVVAAWRRMRGVLEWT